MQSSSVFFCVHLPLCNHLSKRKVRSTSPARAKKRRIQSTTAHFVKNSSSVQKLVLISPKKTIFLNKQAWKVFQFLTSIGNWKVIVHVFKVSKLFTFSKSAKGQLISKALFASDPRILPKNKRNNLIIVLLGKKPNSFVRFYGRIVGLKKTLRHCLTFNQMIVYIFKSADQQIVNTKKSADCLQF